MRDTSLEPVEMSVNIKLIWEQFLQSNPGPSNAQLSQLIIHSEPLGDLALEQFLRQNPTNAELYAVMRDGKSEYKIKAFEALTQQEEPIYNYIVSAIIQIEELREVAWNKLIELGPRGKELRLIAERTEELKAECWKIILNQQISNHELVRVMEDQESLRDAAWQKLIQREYTNAELCRVIKNVPELRQKAWKDLMKRGATNEELKYLIQHVPAVREIAEYKLYKETEDIMKILNGLH